MDASMQQKIALTTAHFPARGRVADMGSGSGSGTHDLARLYPGLELVGVDINPITVEYSASTHRARNLRFVVGDIAERVFEDGSLDAILDSSVLHHVTSFNGFDAGQVARTIGNQVAQLKTGGVVIIRDFVVPDNAGSLVDLELPTDDGVAEGSFAELSTAALFEVFARDFRSSRNRDRGVPFERIGSPSSGFARFRTDLRYAAEFVLRKDYRDHWEPELLEEYTYFAQPDFERIFRNENLRIVVSMPLWNPWIVENRFKDRFRITDLSGASVTFPPTNYLIAGEKVAAGAGVRLSESGPGRSAPEFVKINRYRHRTSGHVYELAERPNRTIDLLPWFESRSGQLFIVAKKDFPRPIVNAGSDSPNLNRANFSGYITEPISAIAADALDIRQILQERANIGPGTLAEIGDPVAYFTSPGGIDECVESRLVRLDCESFETFPIANYTPFAEAGTVRELDALQVLRASHVGGMFDARLEINIYRLLRSLRRSPGAWIGAAIESSDQPFDRFEESLEPGFAAAFERIGPAKPSFLEHKRGRFSETDAHGAEIGSTELDYVVPRRLSKNTTAAIPFVRSGQQIFVGLELRDLPAPQNFFGNSRLACVPAWRLPRGTAHKFDIGPFLTLKFREDFGVDALAVTELGGAYFTSAGITPEIVYPFAAEIDARRINGSDLKFLRFRDLLALGSDLHDAHLLVTLNRLAQAVSIWQ
jgi:hypothetical protein